MSQFIYHAFTPAAIIAIANKELARVGSVTRIKRIIKPRYDVLSGLIHATTTRGADVLIHVWNYGNRQETLCVRGIHRVESKKGRFSLLPNGQACTGLRTYLFNGEAGDAYVAGDDDIARYVKHAFEGVEETHINARIADFQGFAKRACNGPLEAIRMAS